MESETKFSRPPVTEALAAWKISAERGFATGHHLDFRGEPLRGMAAHRAGRFPLRLPDPVHAAAVDALDIAFDHFSETGARLVFYRLGDGPGIPSAFCCATRGLKTKAMPMVFSAATNGKCPFIPATTDAIEEVTDLTRWLRRVKRDRAFHDLDFCMALATIDEIKIYGRPLLPYERFAQRCSTACAACWASRLMLALCRRRIGRLHLERRAEQPVPLQSLDKIVRVGDDFGESAQMFVFA